MEQAADLFRLPTLDSDFEDEDIQLLSEDDDDQMNNDFAFDCGSNSKSSSKRSQLCPNAMPDQGVTTLKPSIASRKIQTENEVVEGEEGELVEIQSKRPKKRSQTSSLPSSSSACGPDNTGDFSSLGLSRVLLANLSKMRIYHPTIVQQKSIPCILQGQDILVNAVTGSGKVSLSRSF